MSLSFLFNILGLFAKTSIFPSLPVMAVVCNTFFWHWFTRNIFCPPRGWASKEETCSCMGRWLRKQDHQNQQTSLFLLLLGIPGLHFIQCSLVLISWLQEAHEGTSLNGHSPAGSLQLGLHRAAAG